MELRFVFSEGLSLRISRLSLTRNSELEGLKERIRKSFKEAERPVSERWESMLEGEGLVNFFPFKGEIKLFLKVINS